MPNGIDKCSWPHTWGKTSGLVIVAVFAVFVILSLKYHKRSCSQLIYSTKT